MKFTVKLEAKFQPAIDAPSRSRVGTFRFSPIFYVGKLWDPTCGTDGDEFLGFETTRTEKLQKIRGGRESESYRMVCFLNLVEKKLGPVNCEEFHFCTPGN